MRDFNLELAKQGYLVCTRDGRPVRLLDFDYKGDDEPIVAIIINPSNGKERLETYSIDGTWDKHNSLDSGLDLMMAPVKHEGWVNIYRDGGWFGTSVKVYQTKEGAIKEAINDKTYIGTTKIEWEE